MIVLSIAAVLALGILLYFDIRLMASYSLHEKKCEDTECECAPVSVVVCAYNAAGTIADTMTSLLASEIKTFEIIVVDDGSSDATREIALQYVSKTVRIVSQDHLGKGAALNNGVNRASFERIIIVDADTTLEPDALGHISSSLDSHDAVCANLQVQRGNGILGFIQAHEHLRIAMFRSAYGTDTVSGACAGFRKDLLLRHPFASSVVEDFEHTQRIRKTGAKIGYAECAIAFTAMPASLGTYADQRLRWSRGTVAEMRRENMSMAPFAKGYAIALADVLLVPLAIASGLWWTLAAAFCFEAALQTTGAVREYGDMKASSLLFFPVLFALAVFSLIFTSAGLVGNTKK